MKIAIHSQVEDIEIILELLAPWKISITSLDEADVIINYKKKPIKKKNNLVIPSNSAIFTEWAKKNQLNVEKKLGKPIFVSANAKSCLTITPQITYHYKSTKAIKVKNIPIITEMDEIFFLLSIDLIQEFKIIINKTLNSRSSIKYRLLTGLPIPYSLAPKKIKDIIMKGNCNNDNLKLYDKLPLDALRFILVLAIEVITDEKLILKTHNKMKTPVLITHDIDTKSGLERAMTVKKLEEKYDVPSAWFVPSNHYTLEWDILSKLIVHGEIGVHDTKHDGKLVSLKNQTLINRLHKAKKTLEEVVGCKINGFRSPLLQHNYTILNAIKQTNYLYDSSIPTFEPKHPRTMGPHGLGTVFPIKICGIMEIPITIIQDHQLLYLLEMRPIDLIELWKDTFSFIRSLGGCCVTLSHPEYKIFDNKNLALYEDLLNMIVCNQENTLMTPTQFSQELIFE